MSSKRSFLKGCGQLKEKGRKISHTQVEVSLEFDTRILGGQGISIHQNQVVCFLHLSWELLSFQESKSSMWFWNTWTVNYVWRWISISLSVKASFMAPNTGAISLESYLFQVYRFLEACAASGLQTHLQELRSMGAEDTTPSWENTCSLTHRDTRSPYTSIHLCVHTHSGKRKNTLAY